MDALKLTCFSDERIKIYNGDCYNLLDTIPDESYDLVISSPPYNIGKAYEKKGTDTEAFTREQKKIIGELSRVLKPGGHICWEVGTQVLNREVVPLDYIVLPAFMDRTAKDAHPLRLISRIVWTFGSGLHAKTRFSGRHEIILCFTKGDGLVVKGDVAPLRPVDIWDIPNVKANHVEKTKHPCQFPSAIPIRLIKALCPPDGIVFDPYMGVGTTGVAAVVEKRRFVGAELSREYYTLAETRIKEAIAGTLRLRPDVPPMKPPKKKKEERYGNGPITAPTGSCGVL